MRIYQNGIPETDQKKDGGSDDEEMSVLFCKESFTCGDPIEPHYYPSGKEATKGRRVTTRQICCICHSSNDLAKYSDVEKHYVRGGIFARAVWLMGCRQLSLSGKEESQTVEETLETKVFFQYL